MFRKRLRGEPGVSITLNICFARVYNVATSTSNDTPTTLLICTSPIVHSRYQRVSLREIPNGPRSHPSLHHHRIRKARSLDRQAVVLQLLVRERRHDHIRTRVVLRPRAACTQSVSPHRTLRRHESEKGGRNETHALMKLRMSPTVCVRFIRATILVPSARRICTLVVGFVWSTSNLVPKSCVLLCALGLPPAEAPLPVALALVLGNEPGIDTGSGVVGRGEADGAGEPKRWPWPENTLAWRALGDGTYRSESRFTTRSSTGCPGETFRICGGARLCKDG